jgi:hypothetical protein
MARYLRFAAAGFFALLTLAVIGLWVRSYYRGDSVAGPFRDTHMIGIGSHYGTTAWMSRSQKRLPDKWMVRHFAARPEEAAKRTQEGFLARLGFGVKHYLMLPHWFLAALSFGLAALAWPRQFWRFTIRTLLLATTLLAGVLGLVVYSI